MTPRRLDTDTHVFFYENEFYPLSNFAAFRLDWRGIVFDTSEHAYHWMKFPNHLAVRSCILNARSAHEAFKIAEQYRELGRSDWEVVRVHVMRAILLAKVEQHAYVKCKLLETGDREIVEDSWRDAFWGIGEDGKGENIMGRLWMEVRAKLRGVQL